MKKAIYNQLAKLFGYEILVNQYRHYAFSLDSAMGWMKCYPQSFGNVVIARRGKLIAARNVI